MKMVICCSEFYVLCIDLICVVQILPLCASGLSMPAVVLISYKKYIDWSTLQVVC